ncbi:PKD domain-containing protein, partial [Crocinitomix algicola]|uniref:PKD domain-containing protein n=1 Tax=Crocinitomix algicola TaxID=1740263 RepID=UPI001112D8CF
DAVTVTVHPLPNVSFMGDEMKGCNPHTINFTTLTPGASYFWDFGDGGVSSASAPSYQYNSAGIYDVTLTITSIEGCVASFVQPNAVEIFEQPVADFSYTPQAIDIMDTEVNFINHADYATTYEWSFGDGTANSSTFEPVHFYPEVGNVTYPVTLIAANDFGCADTITKRVKINDVLIYFIPNTFTPDGDSFNDKFRPQFASGLDIYDFHLMIFNRWGEMVFESYDATGAWDGTYGNGDIVPDGVYVWKMEFGETMTDKKHYESGFVNLMR